jgi:hypothetical protein
MKVKDLQSFKTCKLIIYALQLVVDRLERREIRCFPPFGRLLVRI